MSDVVSHFTICSKTVQQSSALHWIYPETIDSTLVTINSIKDNLKGEDLITMSNNKRLYFFISPEIISSRQFKGCPLLDPPITATLRWLAWLI